MLRAAAAAATASAAITTTATRCCSGLLSNGLLLPQPHCAPRAPLLALVASRLLLLALLLVLPLVALWWRPGCMRCVVVSATAAVAIIITAHLPRLAARHLALLVAAAGRCRVATLAPLLLLLVALWRQRRRVLAAAGAPALLCRCQHWRRRSWLVGRLLLLLLRLFWGQQGVVRNRQQAAECQGLLACWQRHTPHAVLRGCPLKHGSGAHIQAPGSMRRLAGSAGRCHSQLLLHVLVVLQVLRPLCWWQRVRRCLLRGHCCCVGGGLRRRVCGLEVEAGRPLALHLMGVKRLLDRRSAPNRGLGGVIACCCCCCCCCFHGCWGRDHRLLCW
jgi:hypothetical protein